MAAPDTPQLYLITPSEIELSRFPGLLASVLDTHEAACVRLALSSRDEDRIARAVDACREVTIARDVALVIDSHIMLVERLGLDGVHLTDGARAVRSARKTLGPDAIVGSFCAQSRHDGLSAAEAGADYVSFGPAGANLLGDGAQVEPELFEWWSQMIEVPVVAEGALDAALVASLAPHTDFFGLGDEIWSAEDPVAALSTLVEAMG